MAETPATEENLDHVQHHFVDGDQQFESAKMGMWIFLVTEILFFWRSFRCIYRLPSMVSGTLSRSLPGARRFFGEPLIRQF